MFYLYIDDCLYFGIFKDFKSAYAFYRCHYFPLDYRIEDEIGDIVACKIFDYERYKKEILKNG